MLSVLKNSLITRASKESVLIRRRELDWLSRNYWIVATQATVVAGFLFHQISRSAQGSSDPTNGTSLHELGTQELKQTYPAPLYAELLHVLLSSVGFVTALDVLLRATFTGVYAQGLALRGPDGFASIETAISHLRKHQDRMLRRFMGSLLCLVLSCFIGVFNTTTARHSRRQSLQADTLDAAAAASLSRGSPHTGKVGVVLLVVAAAVLGFSVRTVLLFYHRGAAPSSVSGIENVYKKVGDLDDLTSPQQSGAAEL